MKNNGDRYTLDRITLYSRMPPLEISIQDRFKSSRGHIAYTIPRTLLA